MQSLTGENLKIVLAEFSTLSLAAFVMGVNAPYRQARPMDKLQLTGQNLGRILNFRSGHLHAATFLVLTVKLANLQFKTWPKQLLGSLLALSS